MFNQYLYLDRYLFTVTEVKNDRLISRLTEIESELEACKNEDGLRTAEISNLLTAIKAAVIAALDGTLDGQSFSQGVVDEIEPRLKELKENPESAGRHENFRSTFRPGEEFEDTDPDIKSGTFPKE